MTTTNVCLIILSLMCAFLGAVMQKAATMMANDSEVAEEIRFVRQFFPKRKKRR